MKLNLGCGSNRLDGWKNYDADLDFTKRLPFGDNTAEFILIEHALEHTDMRQAFLFMEEARRVLKPGGTLRICVPMLERIKDVAHCRDLIVGHGHQAVWSYATMARLLGVAGFTMIAESERKPCDGHWRVIGVEKDDLESLRVEATK